jgi:hypothetical protein
MAFKNLRRLVVDACVLKSAGGRDHPVSSACTKTLDIIREETHLIVVVTPTIEDEWRRNPSYYSSLWRNDMYSRKKFHIMPDGPDPNLRQWVSDAQLTRNQKQAAMKDVHLLEAARQTDRSIISQEKESLKIFRQIPRVMAGLAWVNPVTHEVEACRWLRSGARVKDWRVEE